MSLTLSLLTVIAIRYEVTGSVVIRKEPTLITLPSLGADDTSVRGGIMMSIAAFGRKDFPWTDTKTKADNSFKFEGNDLPEGVSYMQVVCTDRRYLGDKVNVQLATNPLLAKGDAGTMPLDRLNGTASWDNATTERVVNNAAKTSVFLLAVGKLKEDEAKELYEQQTSLAFVKGGMPNEFATWAKSANETALNDSGLLPEQKDRLRIAFARPTDPKGIKDLAIKNQDYIDKMKSGGLKSLLGEKPSREDIERFLILRPDELDSLGAWKSFGTVKNRFLEAISEGESSLRIKADTPVWNTWILTKDDFLDSKYIKLKFDKSPNIRAYFIAEDLLSKTEDTELTKLLKQYIEKLKAKAGS